MNGVYVPERWKPEELLPRALFEKLAKTGQLHRTWQIMDERLLRSADLLSDEFGPLTCNNWHTGGARNESGLRTPECKEYSMTSQHSYGRAMDVISERHTAGQMRAHILENPALYPYINRLENAVMWLHFDCANAPRIQLFNK